MTRSLQGQGLPTGAPSPVAPVLDPSEDVETLADAFELVSQTLQELYDGFVANLPLIAVGLLVFVIGLLAAKFGGNSVERAMGRTSADRVVVSLTGRLARALLVVAFALLALSIAGVNVAAALATLGIAGLALAFALQNILENFVSGILLMLRKPFRAGDQIRTGDLEGTVEEIDLRVTRLLTYDGVTVLVPNAEVLRNTLVNLTRRPHRRTSVTVGIDYRDDHDRAREVLRQAVLDAEGVLRDPEPEVLLLELGDSSVDFELRYWTLPDNRTVQRTKDRVLSAAKSAVEAAGMTIPWPIRTVSFDDRLRLDRSPPE